MGKDAEDIRLEITTHLYQKGTLVQNLKPNIPLLGMETEIIATVYLVVCACMCVH